LYRFAGTRFCHKKAGCPGVDAIGINHGARQFFSYDEIRVPQAGAQGSSRGSGRDDRRAGRRRPLNWRRYRLDGALFADKGRWLLAPDIEWFGGCPVRQPLQWP